LRLKATSSLQTNFKGIMGSDSPFVSSSATRLKRTKV
jgi:hypothetical protein